MKRLKSLWAYYWKPTSATWLSGFGSIILGVLVAFGEGYMPLQILAEVVAGLAGVTPQPASLILMGLGFMGIGARKGTVGKQEDLSND